MELESKRVLRQYSLRYLLTLFAIYFLYGPEVLHSAPSQSFMRTSIRCMSAACG
jgi:hypothetical protein